MWRKSRCGPAEPARHPGGVRSSFDPDVCRDSRTGAEPGGPGTGGRRGARDQAVIIAIKSNDREKVSGGYVTGVCVCCVVTADLLSQNRDT